MPRTIAATGSVALHPAPIFATTGTVGIATPTASVGTGETVAAVKSATGVSFSGKVTRAASSSIGSNGSVVIGALLTGNDGTLLAAARLSGIAGRSQTEPGCVADPRFIKYLAGRTA